MRGFGARRRNAHDHLALSGAKMNSVLHDLANLMRTQQPNFDAACGMTVGIRIVVGHLIAD